MELKDFVRETLVQISQGVSESMEEVNAVGGKVSPAAKAKWKVADPTHFGALENGKNIFLVEFDVAVNASESTETQGKAKLSVAGMFSLQSGGQSDGAKGSSNRVSFKVPMALPVDPETETSLREKNEREARKTAESIQKINEMNRNTAF